MALPGKTLAGADAASQGGRVMMLDIGTVKPDPNQPRSQAEFDSPDLAELAGSIKKYGILQPIMVEPGDGPAQFRVIMGERRLRAAKLAGLTKIPAILGKIPDDERDLRQIHENLQRKAFSTEALIAAVERQLAAGKKQADIAEAFNVRKEVISRYVTLAKAPPNLRELATTVSSRTLYVLAKLQENAPDAVAAFIASTKPDDIDRGSVQALATRLQGQSTAPLPADEKLSQPINSLAASAVPDPSTVDAGEPDEQPVSTATEPLSSKGHTTSPPPSLTGGSAKPVGDTSETAASGGVSRRKAASGFRLFFRLGDRELELDLAATASRQDGACVLLDALGEPVQAPFKNVRLVEVRAL